MSNRSGSFSRKHPRVETSKLGLTRFKVPDLFSSPVAPRSVSPARRKGTLQLIILTVCGVFLGFYIGVLSSQFGDEYVVGDSYLQEGLPLEVIVPETDLYQRRLWGKPSEDIPSVPSKYLVTFTVGLGQKGIVDKAVSKFPKDWTFLLFHYDDRVDEWDDLEWSKSAIHISAPKQTKWWYAKRFLHPDVVAPYEYIFVWDEDLGAENFDAEKYIQLVKKYGLEISQPALNNVHDNGVTWRMTKRRADVEVHKSLEDQNDACDDPLLPPCAAFVEIMAPVFSNKAWRCVWHMIQNDLVHGWGLDLNLRRCVEPAHEKIGIIDAQWIVHEVVPSLRQQGEAEDGKEPWGVVRERCKMEWKLFEHRITMADKLEFKNI